MIGVGIDLGLRRDPTAIAVAETEERDRAPFLALPRRLDVDDQDRTPRIVRETVYRLRHIERMPLDTPYTVVARHLARLVAQLYVKTRCVPDVYVDHTGVGLAVVEMLEVELTAPHRLFPVTLTATDRSDAVIRGGRQEYRTGKAWLVSRLQAILQGDRLSIPNTPEGKALHEELQIFEIRATSERHDEFGARGSGKHDDLVISAALSCMTEPTRIAGIADPDEIGGRRGRWRDWV